MKCCTKCNEFKSEDLMADGVCNTCESVRPELFQKLQSRILELETELKKQKLATNSSSKVIQMLWGYKFNTESLH